MKRFTEKRGERNTIPLRNAVCGLDMPKWSIGRPNDLEMFLSGDAADRLAAYEDTGFEPEEVAQMGNALKLQSVMVNEASHYWSLQQQGLLVILPCKVGDTLFINDWSEQCGRDTQFACRVQGISLSSSRNDVILHFGGYPIKNVWGSEIGKTIYRTREEAKAALEAKRNE